MLLIEATIKAFGYHPLEISPTSHKRVICVCPQCEQPYETQRRYYREGKLCWSCSGRQSIKRHRDKERAVAALQQHNQLSKEAGVSPKGLPLVADKRRRYKEADKERATRQNREAQQRRRQTLIGKVTNRLRVALRKYLNGHGGFSALPYTPAELQAHIQAKLEERQYRCPMCGASLEEDFDIDHRVPLSSAKTVEEVTALFALANLDVLCPPCNQHKKRAKIVDY
jgi:5-methylcytosine-specific restriction endonuclease McrA